MAKAKKARDQAKAKAEEAGEKEAEAIKAKADAEELLAAQEAKVKKLDLELKEARAKAEATIQAQAPPMGADWFNKLVPEAAKKLEDPGAKQAVATLETILGQAREAFEKLGAFLPKEEEAQGHRRGRGQDV